ncbi:MAG: CDP-alcohol phosphatidyltransferase family protein [Tannerella sp.]|nr:CDP-alcohol phosphatidyltransferase family protein [Tannerella sp.]
MNNKQLKRDIESTLKSMDTEEFIDLHFYRPVGYRWALFFNRLGVTPNTVTVISIVIGIAAGICFYFPGLKVNLFGMLLLVWANSYDSADGQLARMTGRKTPLGRILDGASGELWFIAIYAAISFRLMPLWGCWIWLLAAVAGFCHSKQAAMADYYRNIHLRFLKGESGSELSDSAVLRENYRKRTWKRDGVLKPVEYFYLQYTVGQEAWAPHFRRMMGLLREKYRGDIPESFRAAFRLKSLPLMKYANMLSFNTRVMALFIALFIDIPWLYFVFELTVLNGMLVYLVFTHERFCAAFGKQLASCEP